MEKVRLKKIKRASEPPKATESGLMAEAAGAAMPTVMPLLASNQAASPKTNFTPSLEGEGGCK